MVTINYFLNNEDIDEDDRTEGLLCRQRESCKFVLKDQEYVANFPNSVYDNGVIFKLSGLEFLNSTYSPKTGNNSRTYDMLLCNLTTTGGTFNYSPNISLCNFKKSQDNVKLTIDINRMTSDIPAVYGVNDKFPHMCLSFDIFAIKE